MLAQPLVFNEKNNFITSNGVQSLTFNKKQYVDIKFIEINTLIQQEGWVGKVWIRIYKDKSLIGVLEYNSAVDPKYGYASYICSSGQAAYSVQEAASSCLGGRVKREGFDKML
jgi:hypothetical protein